jgi:hypothetical protein
MNHRISVVNRLLFDENSVPTRRSLPSTAERRSGATLFGPLKAGLLL